MSAAPTASSEAIILCPPRPHACARIGVSKGRRTVLDGPFVRFDEKDVETELWFPQLRHRCPKGAAPVAMNLWSPRHILTWATRRPAG